MEKLLTVIVPVYNDASNICRCLDSLVNQTYNELDIIVVNDASTDDTLEILKSYNKIHPITIIDLHTNSGAATCRNMGISASQTPYVTFVDSDDWVDISAYAQCVQQMNNCPDVIGYGLVYDYVELNRREEKYIYPHTYKMPGEFALGIYAHTIPNEIKITPIVNNKVYRKQFLLDNQISFHEELRYQEDDVFTFEVLANAKMVIFVNGASYHYCQRNGSLIHNVSELSVQNFISAYLTLKCSLEAHNLFEKYRLAYYLKLKGSLLGAIIRIIDFEPDLNTRSNRIHLLFSLLFENFDMIAILNTVDFSAVRRIL